MVQTTASNGCAPPYGGPRTPGQETEGDGNDAGRTDGRTGGPEGTRGEREARRRPRAEPRQELARQLWETADTAARLLALLICRPKAFERDELDVMVRAARSPKVHDWLVNYVVKKSSHAEELRLAWLTSRVPAGRSPPNAWRRSPTASTSRGCSTVIEAEMKDAPDRPQWAMNHCLAQIGIEHAGHRARAMAIGERLEVLKDCPTAPDCTSPFAPVWIPEMVRRHHEK